MKAKNTNLNNAKKEKNDEFYTLLEDIEKEIGGGYLEYNPDLFRDKTILCPCDDPTWSNFTLYFIQNFEKLGLKRLISSCYANPDITGETRGKVYILEQGDPIPTNLNDIHYHLLDGDGSFRSDEVTRFRDSADFVITNPPFSLFRDFMDWVIEGGCKFSVIGNKNCVTYNEVFPHIKNNKMWSGFLNWGSMDFLVRYSKEMKNIPAIWVTNIRHGKLLKPLYLSKTYTPEEYPKYDNYDAIEVSKTKDIPIDYTGAIGVPISFLDKYCPDQFEIVDNLNTPKLQGKGIYKRLIIKHKKPLAQN